MPVHPRNSGRPGPRSSPAPSGRYHEVSTAVGMMVTFAFQRENRLARKLLPHTTRSLARAKSGARRPPVFSQTASSTSRIIGRFAIAWRGAKAGRNWRETQVTSALQEQVRAAMRDAAVAAIQSGRRPWRWGRTFPQGRGYSRTVMPCLLSGSMYWRTRARALGTITPPVYAATRTFAAPARRPSANVCAGGCREQNKRRLR